MADVRKQARTGQIEEAGEIREGETFGFDDARIAVGLGESREEGPDVTALCDRGDDGGSSAIVADDLPPEPKPPATPPGVRLMLTGYDIRRMLGMGGVGVVYLARSESDGQLYALKVLRSSLQNNAEVTARFRRHACESR